MAHEHGQSDERPQVRPLIGVSRCLLGEPVRYDGDSNRVGWIADVLSSHCDFLPLCPEVEAGLGVPRPRIRLIAPFETPRAVLQSEPERDITDQLNGVIGVLAQSADQVDGMILKARSPSCGLSDVPIIHDARSPRLGAGLLTRACLAARPGLPIIDEQGLLTEAQRVAFLITVFRYHCRRVQRAPAPLQPSGNG